MTERRHVHQLRLRVARPQDAGRGQQLLAEALRLAALPEEGMPGTLLVRHLELGTLRLGEAPAALALRVAERVRDAASGAVSYLDPRAPEARAVWASAEPAAAVALARHGAGAITLRLDAWHWPRLVPGVEPGMDRPSVQRLAVRALASRPEPQPVLVELVKLLASEGCAERFIEQLEPALDSVLLRAAGLSPPHRTAHPKGETDRFLRGGVERRPRAWASSRDLQRLTRLAHAVITRFGPEHPRSLWLCHALHLAAAPGGALDPELGGQVLELARHLARAPGAGAARPGGAVGVGARAPAATSRKVPTAAEPNEPEDALATRVTRAGVAGGEPAFASVSAQRDTEVRNAGGGDAADGDTVPSDAAGVRRPASGELPGRAPRVPSSSWEAFASPQATEFGGLFFLLNVLQRLQIAAFLAQHPELADAWLAALWLARVARRLEIPVTDPVWAALASPAASEDDVSFVMPGVWGRELYDLSSVYRCSLGAGPGVVWVTPQGAPIALYFAEPPPALDQLGALVPAARREPYPAARPVDVVLDAWDHAVLGWLERHSALRLPAIVRRPGAVMLTRTHLDVIFDLECADARVRRAALDVDLGYLPWFARVVTFFYARRPELGPPNRPRPASTAA